ncbi:MAG: hypothetical protein WDZ52_11160 [Pseudohongiellaceae bacterium]
MADATAEKSQVEQARDVIAQLKEMQFYAKTNVEKLAELWLLMEEKIKLGDMTKTLEELLAKQNTFQDALEAAISDFEMECNRIENEGD